jgi:hypothetical protein
MGNVPSRVKIAAMVRTLPGDLAVGFAVQAAGSRCSIRIWFMRIVHEKDLGGKDLDCGSAELSVNLVLTRGHGCLLLDL